MMRYLQKLIGTIAFVAVLWPSHGFSQTRDLGGTGQFLDGIAAIVNDGVVLRSEVEIQLQVVLDNFGEQQEQLVVVIFADRVVFDDKVGDTLDGAEVDGVQIVASSDLELGPDGGE